MTDKQLYDIFGFKPYVEPIRPKNEVIVSIEAPRLFKLAANAIQQNHTQQFSVTHTDRLVTEYKDNIAIKNTRFIYPYNLETLRGSTIDVLYIDKMNVIEMLEVKTMLYPAAKQIIMLDKQEDV